MNPGKQEVNPQDTNELSREIAKQSQEKLFQLLEKILFQYLPKQDLDWMCNFILKQCAGDFKKEKKLFLEKLREENKIDDVKAFYLIKALSISPEYHHMRGLEDQEEDASFESDLNELFKDKVSEEEIRLKARILTFFRFNSEAMDVIEEYKLKSGTLDEQTKRLLVYCKAYKIEHHFEIESDLENDESDDDVDTEPVSELYEGDGLANTEDQVDSAFNAEELLTLKETFLKLENILLFNDEDILKQQIDVLCSVMKHFEDCIYKGQDDKSLGVVNSFFMTGCEGVAFKLPIEHVIILFNMFENMINRHKSNLSVENFSYLENISKLTPILSHIFNQQQCWVKTGEKSSVIKITGLDSIFNNLSCCGGLSNIESNDFNKLVRLYGSLLIKKLYEAELQICTDKIDFLMSAEKSDEKEELKILEAQKTQLSVEAVRVSIFLIDQIEMGKGASFSKAKLCYECMQDILTLENVVTKVDDKNQLQKWKDMVFNLFAEALPKIKLNTQVVKQVPLLKELAFAKAYNAKDEYKLLFLSNISSTILDIMGAILSNKQEELNEQHDRAA